jgi:DNA polymerase-1
VIEKFGVPPEKVVEVQALAGDSTDNVPGVPGIGIKTAAQLIVEYGDLETLLNRAGEIKQPKRREALIENAEKARISRQLVLLDDKVELEVPLAELAVHEPDARKLIAFLKAMEFSTLTRRVAEYAQIDPADIEPDPGYKSGASVFAPPPSGGRPGGEAARGESTPFDSPGSPAAPTLPLKGGSSAPRLAQGRKGDTQPLTPISLRRRAPKRRARPGSIAASIRPSAASKSSTRWSRAFTMSATSPSRPRRRRSIDAGRDLRHRDGACGDDACYVPLGHKQSGDGAGLFAAASRRTRSGPATPSTPCARCWNRQGFL